jgi:hypothetical protein
VSNQKPISVTERSLRTTLWWCVAMLIFLFVGMWFNQQKQLHPKRPHVSHIYKVPPR